MKCRAKKSRAQATSSFPGQANQQDGQRLFVGHRIWIGYGEARGAPVFFGTSEESVRKTFTLTMAYCPCCPCSGVCTWATRLGKRVRQLNGKLYPPHINTHHRGSRSRSEGRKVPRTFESLARSLAPKPETKAVFANVTRDFIQQTSWKLPLFVRTRSSLLKQAGRKKGEAPPRCLRDRHPLCLVLI